MMSNVTDTDRVVAFLRSSPVSDDYFDQEGSTSDVEFAIALLSALSAAPEQPPRTDAEQEFLDDLAELMERLETEGDTSNAAAVSWAVCELHGPPLVGGWEVTQEDTKWAFGPDANSSDHQLLAAFAKRLNARIPVPASPPEQPEPVGKVYGFSQSLEPKVTWEPGIRIHAGDKIYLGAPPTPAQPDIEKLREMEDDLRRWRTGKRDEDVDAVDRTISGLTRMQMDLRERYIKAQGATPAQPPRMMHYAIPVAPPAQEQERDELHEAYEAGWERAWERSGVDLGRWQPYCDAEFDDWYAGRTRSDGPDVATGGGSDSSSLEAVSADGDAVSVRVAEQDGPPPRWPDSKITPEPVATDPQVIETEN